MLKALFLFVALALAQDEQWSLKFFPGKERMLLFFLRRLLFFTGGDETCSDGPLTDISLHWPSKCTLLPSFPSMAFRDEYGNATTLVAYEVASGGYGSVSKSFS
jgi:hypothetical protein